MQTGSGWQRKGGRLVRAVYLLTRLIATVLGYLPRGAAHIFAKGLVRLFYWADRKHRHIGMTNLRIAFPERDDPWREVVLRRSFEQVGTHVVDVCRMARQSPSELRGLFRYEEGFGLEHYYEAKKQKRGLLFLTAHISAWELLPSAHAISCRPLSFVVRPLDNAYLDRWLTAVRSRFGNTVLSKFASLRPILRILKENGDVGFLIDQNVQAKDGVFAPFFGMPACTTSSVAALALKTGAPILPGFIVPDEESGKFVIRFFPAFTAEDTGDHERDLVRITARCNQSIENVIREFPHCWLWGHRRFRTQPDQRDPYA